MIRYSSANRKLEKLAAAAGVKLSNVYSFNLPAGHSCPFARDCKATADRHTGKITDGTFSKFRCYAASLEAVYSNVRTMYWKNFDTLRTMDTADEMAAALLSAMPKKARVIRIHTAGDFFNIRYFRAWLKVASMRPDVTFYAYTKSLAYWIEELGNIPANMRLTASKGSANSELIEKHGLRFSQVVSSEEEAAALGLPVDVDDTHAFFNTESFALVIHGTQPKKK